MATRRPTSTSCERGPLRVRLALQFSLNIPAVKALPSSTASSTCRARPGVRAATSSRRPPQRRAVDGARARSRSTRSTSPRLRARSPTGAATSRARVDPLGHERGRARTSCRPTRSRAGDEVISPQAAYIVTDILAGNTDPAGNPIWGRMRITDENGRRRPAALKTGTTNDAKDLSAYGYIAPPTNAGRARRRVRARRGRLGRQQRRDARERQRRTPSSRSTSRRRCGRRS